jgi:hypothetical protein
MLIWEGDRVHRLHVRVEEPKVFLRRIPRLLVLVEHGKHVRLQHPGPLGRAPPDVVDRGLVVSARVVHGRREPAGGRPPGLPHDDPDVRRPGLLQRGVDGVHHGVEQVRVDGVQHGGAPVSARNRATGTMYRCTSWLKTPRDGG